MSNTVTRKIEKPYSRPLRNVSLLFDTIAEPSEQSQTKVALSKIQLPPRQPRRHFDAEKLEGLKISIANHGILQPLLVRPLDEGYELVAGERRYRAASQLNLEQVPVIICQLSETEACAVALIENLQREELNPIEETFGILELLALNLDCDVQKVKSLLHRMRDEVRGKVPHNVMGNEEAEMVTNLFEQLGKLSWESFVNNRLPLLNLPSELIEVLEKGQLAYTKATAIASIDDPVSRQNLLSEALSNQLSLSQIKERIRQLKLKTDKEVSESPSRTLDDLNRRLKKFQPWKDPVKWKKLKTLLSKIEALMEEEVQPPEELNNN